MFDVLKLSGRFPLPLEGGGVGALADEGPRLVRNIGSAGGRPPQELDAWACADSKFNGENEDFEEDFFGTPESGAYVTGYDAAWLCECRPPLLMLLCLLLLFFLLLLL